MGQVGACVAAMACCHSVGHVWCGSLAMYDATDPDLKMLRSSSSSAICGITSSVELSTCYGIGFALRCMPTAYYHHVCHYSYVRWPGAELERRKRASEERAVAEMERVIAVYAEQTAKLKRENEIKELELFKMETELLMRENDRKERELSKQETGGLSWGCWQQDGWLYVV